MTILAMLSPLALGSVHLFDVTVTNIAGENSAGEKVEGKYRITSGRHAECLTSCGVSLSGG